MPAQPQPDGGRVALAGFLYQIVGLLGLKATAHATGTAVDGAELDAVVTVDKDGLLSHEAYGQDAVLTTIVGGEAGLSLVQFKYSRGASPRPIFRDEFDGIVRRLADSVELAEGLGQRVTGFYLITNRAVSKTATGPQSSTASRAKTSRKGGKNPTPATAASPRQNRVREGLTILSDVPLDHWREELRRFAAQFGCLDQDVEKGIESLVGLVVTRTVERSELAVEEETLIEAFTGCPTTKRITQETLKVRSVEQVVSFSDKLGHPGPLVRRRLFDDLSSAVSQRALVILEGPGGCGKTTTLAAWALEVLEAPPPSPGALTTISCASEISPCWIREVICDYSGLPTTGHARRIETDRVAIDRLAVANPGALPPILLLGLDGLDEGEEYADRRRAVREVLEWLREEDQRSATSGRRPVTTGIVTCRDRREVISQLNLDLAGAFSRDWEPAIIPVGDFTPHELLEAAGKDYAHAHGRFRISLERLGRLVPGSLEAHPGAQLLESAGATAAPIQSEILDTLRHPVMWRSLLHLAPETRERALNGEADATRDLARAFTERWFCPKVRRRNLNLPDAVILEILGQVARKCRDAGHTYTFQAGWHAPAISTELVNRQQAQELYGEAISSGYILVSERHRWRWRHPMCVDYLASAQAPE